MSMSLRRLMVDFKQLTYHAGLLAGLCGLAASRERAMRDDSSSFYMNIAKNAPLASWDFLDGSFGRFHVNRRAAHRLCIDLRGTRLAPPS
jgi:hypothetical protein